MFGNGIFNSNGEQWHSQREFAKALFTQESLRSTTTVFEKYAHQLLGHLESHKLQSNIDIQDFMMRYTLSSFGEVGFGAQLHAIEQDVNRFAIAFDYVQTKSYVSS